MNWSVAWDHGERGREAAGNGLLIDNPVPSTDWSDRTTDNAIDCSTTAPGITAQTIRWNRDADAAERVLLWPTMRGPPRQLWGWRRSTRFHFSWLACRI